MHYIVLFGRPEGSLSPLRFCSSHVAHNPSWEKASYTPREGTPYEPGSGRSFKRCWTLGTQCLTHTLRGKPSLAPIPFVMPHPCVHNIVLFGRPKGSLSPSRFCSSHAVHNPSWEKASYTPKEGTLMNQALDAYLSDVGLLAPSASPTPLEESHPHRLNECLELGS